MRYTTFTKLIEKEACLTHETDGCCEIYDHAGHLVATIDLKNADELKVTNSIQHIEIGKRFIEILEICIKFAKTPINER